MEWIVAIGAFLLISALVIGLPLYLTMKRWSSRTERRAAESRRRAAAARPDTSARPRRRRGLLSL